MYKNKKAYINLLVENTFFYIQESKCDQSENSNKESAGQKVIFVA